MTGSQAALITCPILLPSCYMSLIIYLLSTRDFRNYCTFLFVLLKRRPTRIIAMRMTKCTQVPLGLKLVGGVDTRRPETEGPRKGRPYPRKFLLEEQAHVGFAAGGRFVEFESWGGVAHLNLWRLRKKEVWWEARRRRHVLDSAPPNKNKKPSQKKRNRKVGLTASDLPKARFMHPESGDSRGYTVNG